jgi:hypothetical protein
MDTPYEHETLYAAGKILALFRDRNWKPICWSDYRKATRPWRLPDTLLDYALDWLENRGILRYRTGYRTLELVNGPKTLETSDVL